MATISANGISHYYQISGSGEPILWIQGLGADHTAWLAQLSAFSRDFRCVAYDNRDVGRSEQAAAPYAVRDMAEDAAQLVAQLGLGRVHVVGVSMGGAIGQELALQYPHLLRSLVLVSSLARPDARLRHLVEAWADGYLKLGPVDFYRLVLPWLFSYRFFERPRAAAALLRYAANHGQEPAAFARQARASLRHDTVDRLATVTAPTLVVAGEEDILVPQRFARFLASAIPGASLATIPGVGHSANVEQVSVFDKVVGEFLRDV